MVKFFAALLLAASTAAKQPISLYKASFDAVPRAMQDTGDLIAGYGMNGSYEVVNRNNANQDHDLYITTNIRTPFVKNLYYYQSFV